MYGSSDSHWFFTSTSPSAGAGRGVSTMRKFSGVTEACGREARTTCLLTVMTSLRVLRETIEMVVRVAQLAGDHREPAKRMAHLELLAHAHAAVELHRLLAHVAAGIGDLDLRGGHDALPLPRILLGIDARASEARHGARLLVADHHVHHAVLQRLESADRHAELAARLEVFERRVARGLHGAHRLGAEERDRIIGRLLDERERAALAADERIGRNAHRFE